MSAGRSQGYPTMARAPDGQGSAGSARDTAPQPGDAASEAEDRRQIAAILEQGDRDIAAGSGSDWSEVKRRVRARLTDRA